ncbi:MAPEG family protein [Pararhodobacter aggregans]|uniref:MAPEG family protein n=1 Tax=Pararhodobacter aggregans TaxID=404875 RepID=UPI003A904013
MSPELTALTLAALLQGMQFAIFSVTAQMQVGSRYAASPRDEKRELTGIAGRAQRALSNHFEGLILFAIAVMVVSLAGQSSAVTATAAWVFLGARLVYVPAYLFGWTPWRSVFWFVGWLATYAMLIAALL